MRRSGPKRTEGLTGKALFALEQRLGVSADVAKATGNASDAARDR